MNGLSSYRDNPLNWSLPLGQLFGIRIRMHLFFIAFIIIQLAREWLEDAGAVSAWAVIISVLFVIVLLHEFGHCFGARAVGGTADQIMMWPLGGLAYVDAPRAVREQFLVAAAGPLVNVMFCILISILTLALGTAGQLPWNPFQLFPVGPTVLQWSFTDWLVILWSVNYMLLLFNLLPVFPLDGGRMLQTVLWKYQGYGPATLNATYIGMVGAILFVVIGMIQSEGMLLFIGVFGFITCYQQRQMLKAGELDEDHQFGYDFSKGYGAFEEPAARSRPSWLKRRRQARQHKIAERKRKEQELLEQQIDAILDKVHREGMHSLTRQEKKILEAGTARKKNS